MALDTEIGGSASDSYATVAEADAYYSIRPGATKTAWDAASLTDKENALKLAAQEMECFRYFGFKAFEGQNLQFPRDYHTDDDGDNIIDSCVKNAQLEQAGFHIAKAAGSGAIDADDLQELQALGINSVTTGRTSISFGNVPANKDSRINELVEFGFSVKAAKLLSRFITKAGEMTDNIETLTRINELRRRTSFNYEIWFDDEDFLSP